MHSSNPLRGSLAASRTSGKGRTLRLITNAKKKSRDYGTGRARLGLDKGTPPPAADTGAAAAPTLGEYLRFGRMIGDRAQDVQQQLESTSVPVRVDSASTKYLEDWQNEQLKAYEMFESLVEGEAQGTTNAAASSKLMRNKNRAVQGFKTLEKFMGQEIGSAPRPISAAERKLSRNRVGRAVSYMQTSSLEDVDDVAGAFELVAVRPTAQGGVPSMLAKPPRTGMMLEEDELDSAWEEMELSEDEEWEDEEATPVGPQEPPPPPPTYGDFEAALKKPGGQSSGSGNVRINLNDVPRKPRAAAPPVSLSAKPVSRGPEKVKIMPPQAPLPTPKLASPPKSKNPPLPATSPPPVQRVIEMPTIAPKPATARASEPEIEQLMPVADRPEVVEPVKAVVVPPPALKAPPQNPVKPTAPKPVLQKVEEEEPKMVEAETPAVVVEQVHEESTAISEEQEGEESAAPEPPVVAVSRPVMQPRKQQPPSPSPSLATSQLSFPDRDTRRARSVQAAQALLATRGHIEATVWQVNSAGVLVEGAGITGFIPYSELAPVSVAAVKQESQRLLASGIEEDAPNFRRDALAALLKKTLVVEVRLVDSDSGRVILSEKAAFLSLRRRPGQPVSPAALSAAAARVGQVVDARVRSVREFGVFVEFSLDAGEGVVEDVFGLVHSSEVAWDSAGIDAPNPADSLRPGQHVQAKVLHVDNSKGRIFLSIRRAAPNPLLETLDSLLAGTGSPAQGASGSEGGGNDTTIVPLGGSSATGPRQTMDASTDLRPLMGDLEVAARFVQEIAAEEGVVSAGLGARLQSRASSQEVEVYLAKADAGGEAISPGAVVKYKMVLRKGMDVQEVEVESSLGREGVRALAAVTVRRLTEEGEEQ